MESKADDFVLGQVRTMMEGWRIETARKTSGTDRLRQNVADAEAELAAYLEATKAAGLGIADFASGAQTRRDVVIAARSALDAAVRVSPLTAVFETGADALDAMDVVRRNQFLRRLLDAVVVAPVGRGKNVAAADRVRVFSAGTLALNNWRGEVPIPVAALPFPDADDERLLRVHPAQD